MEEVTLPTESLGNTQVLNGGKGNQAMEMPSGCFVKPWCEQDIHSFLQEWESIQLEIYPRKKKNHAMSRAIAQRLSQRGIKKSWKQCYSMLISLQDLYWTIREANRRPRSEPLPCPYGEALQRIMGYQWKNNNFSDPLADHGADFPHAVYQPQDCGVFIPSEELPWAPMPMTFVADLPVHTWERWTMNPLWTPPYFLPAVLPGALGLQHPCFMTVMTHPDPQKDS